MFRCILRSFVLFGVAAIALASNASARAQDRYFMMIFANDANPPSAKLAHTYATFVKIADKKNEDGAEPAMEVRTISWLPASLDIRLLAPPEQGTNLDLPATLKLAKSQPVAVSMWGPFEIKKELYDRASSQIERLASGKVAFKSIDRRFRPAEATNCFHAISDIVGDNLLDTGTAYGTPATEMVLQHLSPWFVEPTKLHREVANRLGLGGYAITYRDEVPRLVKTPEK